MGLRRHGVLLDPHQRQLQIPGGRGHRLERLHLPHQPPDRLCRARQHGSRRPFHLLADAAQTGQRRTPLRRLGDGHEHRGQRLLRAAPDLFGGGDLAPVHPAGAQQTFRAVQRDVALGRRHAGPIRQRFARERHLRDGLHPLAGHLAGHRGLCDQQHGRRGERRRDGYHLQPCQAGSQPGHRGQPQHEHDELQGQHLLDRPRHGLLPLKAAQQ